MGLLAGMLALGLWASNAQAGMMYSFIGSATGSLTLNSSVIFSNQIFSLTATGQLVDGSSSSVNNAHLFRATSRYVITYNNSDYFFDTAVAGDRFAQYQQGSDAGIGLTDENFATGFMGFTQNGSFFSDVQTFEPVDLSSFNPRPSPTPARTQTNGSSQLVIAANSVYLDSASSFLTVPEPATLALLGLGLVVIGWWRGRQSTKDNGSPR